MLVFAISDKGGTGRSVSGANIAYRSAAGGDDTCYVDFDFGSPTVGAVFGISALESGTDSGRGTHSLLQGATDLPEFVDVWSASEDDWVRDREPGSGRLTLIPGDRGGSEFPIGPDMLDRTERLFQRLEGEFALSIIDLSAGRSYAAQVALQATRSPRLRAATVRWLVFHRWTRQHVAAASHFIRGPAGLIETGRGFGHDADELRTAIRVVRTAVVDPASSELTGLRTAQVAWFLQRDRELHTLAATKQIGETMLLAAIPLDPVLQWREQLLTGRDLYQTQVANPGTVAAFELINARLRDPRQWQPR
jgi:hypothetical protein